MRKQRIVLEYHADMALIGRQRGDILATYQHASIIRRQKSGDDIQQRSFAAAAWPEQGEKLTLLNGNADVIQGAVVIKLPRYAVNDD